MSWILAILNKVFYIVEHVLGGDFLLLLVVVYLRGGVTSLLFELVELFLKVGKSLLSSLLVVTGLLQVCLKGSDTVGLGLQIVLDALQLLFCKRCLTLLVEDDVLYGYHRTDKVKNNLFHC